MREGAFTYSADKGFLSCVSSIMSVQVTSTREGAFTDYAGKWFLTSVSSVIYNQITWPRKSLVTGHTPVLHGVQWSGNYWCLKTQGVTMIYPVLTLKINNVSFCLHFFLCFMFYFCHI